MSLPYFGLNSWGEITREERLFCAELYHAVGGREAEFVSWLSNHPTVRTSFDEQLSWSIEYEVNLYRDLLFSVGRKVSRSKFSNKRTFDLCLFSPTDIVLIEAKAQQSVSTRQMKDFASDREHVLEAIHECGFENTGVRVTLLALLSSRCIENLSKYGRKEGVPAFIDGYLSWKDCAEFSPNPLFDRADAIYRK